MAEIHFWCKDCKKEIGGYFGDYLHNKKTGHEVIQYTLRGDVEN